MTNQNDTQDEAELIASKILSKVRGIEILPDVRDDMYSREIKMIAEGYRAGKEPQLNLNRMLLSTNGSLKETVAALQEELNQSKRETQAAVHLCKQDRAEVERLKQVEKYRQEGYSALRAEQNPRCYHPDEYLATWEDGTAICWECEWTKAEADLADSRAEVERLKMEIEEAIGGRDQWRKTQLELNAEKARSKKLVEAVKFYVIHIANSDSIDMQLLIDARRSLRDCLRAYSTDSGDGEKG